MKEISREKMRNGVKQMNEKYGLKERRKEKEKGRNRVKLKLAPGRDKELVT